MDAGTQHLNCLFYTYTRYPNLVSIVPADILVHNGPGSSADTVLTTKLDVILLKAPVAINDFYCSNDAIIKMTNNITQDIVHFKRKFCNDCHVAWVSYDQISVWWWRTVRSWRCGCFVTWFCYQLMAKPGNKTAAPSWPDPDHYSSGANY